MSEYILGSNSTFQKYLKQNKCTLIGVDSKSYHSLNPYAVHTKLPAVKSIVLVAVAWLNHLLHGQSWITDSISSFPALPA